MSNEKLASELLRIAKELTAYHANPDVPLGEIYRKGREWVAEVHFPDGTVDRSAFLEGNERQWAHMRGVRSAKDAAKAWVLNFRKRNRDMEFGRGF